MKLIKDIFPCILLLALLSGHTNAQNTKFEYLTPNEGLSHATVQAILQDKSGFMWFGTQSGLNKFDGYKFTIFSHNTKDSTSIGGDQINCIYEDSHGNLWIGTDGGLSLYDRNLGIFVTYRHLNNNPNSLSDSRVACLFEDKTGQFWVGTNGGGLNLFNIKENKFIHFRHNEADPKSLSNDVVHAIHGDSDGNIWVGTENGGLNLLNTGTNTFTHFLHDASDPSGIPHNNITSVTADKSGNIWIGTLGEGLCKLVKREGGQYNFENYKPNTTDANRTKILSLFVNQRDGIWIGTENGGLDYFDYSLKTFSNYQLDENNPYSLNNNSIHSIFEDKTGNIWVGTYTGGVNVVKKNIKKIFTYRRIPGNPNSLSYNAVSCFYEDSDGLLWVGTDGGGLNLYNQTTGKVIHFNQGNTTLKSNAILTITEDHDGDVLVGGWECALNIYNRKSKTFTTLTSVKNGLPNNNIFDILVGRSGRIWVAFGGIGFAEFDKAAKTFKVYTPANSELPSQWVLNLTEDISGKIVLGHTNGFSIFNPENESFENISNNANDENSLSNNQINDILASKDATFWIGTINGLNHFDPKNNKCTRYYEQNGLPNNNIAGLVEDDHGKIWISTSNGISRFDPKDGSFKNYKLTDGLQGKSYIRNSSYKTSNGEVLFGGTNGFNLFLPDSLHDNQSVPQVVITDFTIFNKSVKINSPHSPLHQDISLTKKIVLNYKQSVFSFEFVALDYTAPSQNQYAYMLEGFEDEWNYIGTKRSASYTNLDPGTYIFHVKGSNNDGIWNEDGVKLEIKVKPPFWKTWIFRISIILLIFSILYTLYKQRMNLAKRDKEILEKKIKEGEEVIQQKILEVDKQAREIRERDLKELESRFMNEGIAKFSNIIVACNGDIQKMSSSILSGLAQYIGVPMGALYVVRNSGGEVLIEMISSYALSRDKEINQWKPGEGYVGTCYNEGRTIVISDVPEGYAMLASGLGKTNINSIYLIPLKYNESVQGVLEVASLKQLEDYKLRFLEKIGENITSFITISNANKQAEALLVQADMQRKELESQEEEMRQNLEEMMAAQEEMRRREDDWTHEKEQFKINEARYLTELNTLREKMKTR